MSITDKVFTIFQQSDLDFKGQLQKICELLAKQNQAYDWVGFYMVNPSKKTLCLKAYYGESTQHTEIPFGKGICGQVAETNQVFISPDVTLESNYLSCSPKVRSEIVYPILINDQNVGQIDIDSHQKNAFNSRDEFLLKGICELVAKNFPTSL